MRPQVERVSGDHGERERRRSAAGLAPTLVRIATVALAAAAVFASPRGAGARDDVPAAEARAGLLRAVEFFRAKAGCEGGYGFRVSTDLVRREGERALLPREAWIAAAADTRATIPADWPRTWPDMDYSDLATLNDGLMADMLRTLLLARDVTGDARYLEPVPRAVAWLARSRLPDGRLARFYELGTNRPLSMTKKYLLTPADDDLPTHYGFEVKATIESLEKALAEAGGPAGPPRPLPRHAGPKKPKGDAARKLVPRIREILAALDPRGAWVEPGKLSSDDRQRGPDGVISSATFIKNIGTLAEYLAATGTSD